MNTSLESISRWILATLLVFIPQLQKSESFTWKRQPNNPTVVVEGINSSCVSLVWSYGLDADEILSSIFLKRSIPGKNQPAVIAKSFGGFTFDAQAGFQNDYKAFLPATLELLNVNNNEEFMYLVEASYQNSIGLPEKKNLYTRIVVYVPPRITASPERKSKVISGHNLTLTCHASGDPTPNITWTKDGVPRDQFNVSGNGLYLVNVQRNDEGSYRCTASNGYGEETSRLAIVEIYWSGLTTAELWGITAGTIAFILIVLICIICLCSIKNKRSGGACKAYSEADGYRRNKQPPSSRLATATPTYIEAGMYAPANAARRKVPCRETPKQLNYEGSTFAKSSNTVHIEHRPAPTRERTEKKEQDKGDFEFWC